MNTWMRGCGCTPAHVIGTGAGGSLEPCLETLPPELTPGTLSPKGGAGGQPPVEAAAGLLLPFLNINDVRGQQAEAVEATW